MIVKAGSDTYVLPLTNIIESLRPERKDVQKLVDRGEVLHIRGEYVRLIHLHRLVGLEGAIEDPCEGIVVLCETEGDNKVGLVVDELLGQQQVVIKSLEANYHPVKGISAATILGSGRVALILDVVGLREMADGGVPGGGNLRLAAQ
jgi:two-component system chemotaxis sensor kinase CheA